ncbi:MAG: endonuclease VIII [Acidobacteriota bacterium]
MIEIPEAVTLSRQLTECFAGRQITRITANISPHKFACYYGKPEFYSEITVGKTFREARAVGGMVEAVVDDVRLLFSEGTRLRYLEPKAAVPQKRQFEVLFSDDGTLVVSVQMYGGMGAFREGENDNPYYLVSQQKLSPLDERFDAAYFEALTSASGAKKLSAKGLLATEQRIPGLGNGVLQDILYRARIHPRKKVGTLGDSDRERLFRSIKETLRDMAENGGRDTETDLFGNPGRYVTIMSRNHVGKPCPACGTQIRKAAYMGGSIYFCPDCQPL